MRNNFKKLATLILTGAMCISMLAGCGEKANTENKKRVPMELFFYALLSKILLAFFLDIQYLFLLFYALF